MSYTTIPMPDDVPWLKARIEYLEGEVERLREAERELERLRREAARASNG